MPGSPPVLALYPETGERALEGLYLREDLHRQGTVLYTNFVASVDGRIALSRPGRATHEVPRAIANPRDWRLFQELAAQADVLITSARFFRQSLDEEAQDSLPVGPEFGDLRDWRLAEGRSAQPDVAIASASLDLPVAMVERYRERSARRLFVVTGARADAGRRQRLEESGIEVVTAGTGAAVGGERLRRVLGEMGYRSQYAVAGPQLLHTLLADRALDRLYLTTAGRLLGGTGFDTLCWGEQLDPAPRLRLRHLHYDPGTPAGAGQLFAAYDCAYGD